MSIEFIGNFEETEQNRLREMLENSGNWKIWKFDTPEDIEFYRCTYTARWEKHPEHRFKASRFYDFCNLLNARNLF